VLEDAELHDEMACFDKKPDCTPDTLKWFIAWRKTIDAKYMKAHPGKPAPKLFHDGTQEWKR
jgi:hypothetical protein